MPQVALIPTGTMEYEALGPALERLFPGVEFILRPKGTHRDGFTSRDVSPLVGSSPSKMSADLDKLAAELVNAVQPGRHDIAADFAFVVEDLELVNDGQPHLVVQVFRDAVDRHIRNNWPSLQAQTRAYDCVRDRCSFHLFRPMTEAYFFGEPDALQRAGAVLPHQLQGGDLEEFQSSDQTFLQLPADLRPKHKRCVVDMPQRERHPKSYLHYLCDPTLSNKQKKYKESGGGVVALRTLDWSQVLAAPPHCPFLHAFLDDLAEAVNHRPPFVDPNRACPLTKYSGGKKALLRNL